MSTATTDCWPFCGVAACKHGGAATYDEIVARNAFAAHDFIQKSERLVELIGIYPGHNV